MAPRLPLSYSPTIIGSIRASVRAYGGALPGLARPNVAGEFFKTSDTCCGRPGNAGLYDSARSAACRPLVVRPAGAARRAVSLESCPALAPPVRPALVPRVSRPVHARPSCYPLFGRLLPLLSRLSRCTGPTLFPRSAALSAVPTCRPRRAHRPTEVTPTCAAFSCFGLGWGGFGVGCGSGLVPSRAEPTIQQSSQPPHGGR